MTQATEGRDELTPAETAVLLARSVRTVERYIASARLPAVRKLGRVVVSRADVEKLLAAEPIGAAEAAG
jgi:excisionase family DNA binding protein